MLPSVSQLALWFNLFVWSWNLRTFFLFLSMRSDRFIYHFTVTCHIIAKINLLVLYLGRICKYFAPLSETMGVITSDIIYFYRHWFGNCIIVLDSTNLVLIQAVFRICASLNKDQLNTKTFRSRLDNSNISTIQNAQINNKSYHIKRMKLLK